MARYPDLRYKFIRGLIKYEHRQRRHHFLKSAAEWTSKAIVSLSLIDYPVRSTKQAMQLEGVGPVIASELNKILQDTSLSTDPPCTGKFPSTASALLVALLNGTEEERKKRSSDLPLVEEDKLKECCQPLSEEKFNPKSYSSDGTPINCPAWWRINVLISRGLVKKRTRGKRPVYELLPAGENLALQLRGDASQVQKSTSSFAERRRILHKKQTQSENEQFTFYKETASTSSDALYSNDDGSDGVVLLVDRRELGGDRSRLGELSRRLSEWQVTHKTCSLPCGDYMWKWRHAGKEFTLPLLMERKRADDLAESIRDGRYFSQMEKMIQWKKDFGTLSEDVSLQYVVESEPAAYRVTCTDGCGGVGKCGNPTVEQVEDVIRGLEESTDFQLLKTQNIEGTVEVLASITAELVQRVDKGEFKALKSSSETLVKSSYKNHKVKRASTAGGRDILCTSSFNVDETKESNSGTSSERLSRNTSRKRSHFQEIKFNDLEEGSVVQVSPSKKRRRFSEIRRTLGALDCKWEDDSLLRIPEQTDRINVRYRQNVDENCFPFIRSEFSDLDDDFPSFIAVDDKDCYSELSASEIIPEDLSSSHTPKDEQSDEVKIKTLKEMVPDSSLDDIIIALSSTCGNVGRAVEKLKKKDARSSGLICEPSLMHLSGSTYAGSTKEWDTNSYQSDEAKIAKMQKALPDTSLENIIVALASSGGNVDEAIRAISASIKQNPSYYEPENKVNLTEPAQNVKTVYGNCHTVVLRSPNTKSYEMKKDTDLAANQTSFSQYEPAKVAFIRDVLPKASLENIISSLNSEGGNVEKAITESMKKAKEDIEPSNTKLKSMSSCVKNPNNSEIIFVGDVQLGKSSEGGAKSIDCNSVIAIDSDPFDTDVQCYKDYKINAIRNVIPDASTPSIVHALNVNKGEIEEAIINLLNSPSRSRKRNDHTCTVSKPISSKEVIDLT